MNTWTAPVVEELAIEVTANGLYWQEIESHFMWDPDKEKEQES